VVNRPAKNSLKLLRTWPNDNRKWPNNSKR
jgi:hypothetical protein